MISVGLAEHNRQPGLTACAGPDYYLSLAELAEFREATPPRTGPGMIHRSSQILCVWFLIWDLVVTGAAWFGAYFTRFHSGWVPLWKDTPDFALCQRDLP